MLLLTTDGLGAQRLTHPRYAVPRTYVVRVRGEPTDAVARAFERSVTIDRRSVEVQSISVRSAPRGATDVQMTLVEGRHRIVRRVCSELGLQVERLKRTRYGPVRVGRLPIRKWRALSNRERGAIDKLVYVNGN